jgi:hypothetical protein
MYRIREKGLANVGRMYRVRGKGLANVGRMYRVRPKWRKWPFWRVLEFAKLANFRRVLKFDKFAGEWPLLSVKPFSKVTEESVLISIQCQNTNAYDISFFILGFSM